MLELLLPLWRMYPITAQIVRMMEEDPGSWTSSNYETRHPSGVVIWVANSAYGLDLDIKGRGRIFKSFDRHPMQRRFIWRAYRKHVAHRADQRFAPITTGAA